MMTGKRNVHYELHVYPGSTPHLACGGLVRLLQCVIPVS